MDTWKHFEANSLTHSALHYLAAVHELRKKRGYARVTDVAKLLSVTRGSASLNLKVLRAKRLVLEDENKFLSLSRRGQALVSEALAGRNVFLKFLTKILKVKPAQAEIDACKVEHLLSLETIKKMRVFMEHQNEK